MRIALSKHYHFPILKTSFGTYPLWDVLSLWFGVRTKVYDSTCRLLPSHKNMLKGELDIWERFYLPTSIKGRTILDIGGGCGETALFYFHWGASSVICVEKDKDAARLAKKNLAGFSATVLNEPFSRSHLDIPHDFMKMDIEGTETLLLSYDGELKPCVIECHDPKTEEGLRERFRLKMVHRLGEQVTLLSKA